MRLPKFLQGLFFVVVLILLLQLAVMGLRAQNDWLVGIGLLFLVGFIVLVTRIILATLHKK